MPMERKNQFQYQKYIVPDLYSSGIMQAYPGFSCLPARVDMNSSSLSFFLRRTRNRTFLQKDSGHPYHKKDIFQFKSFDYQLHVKYFFKFQVKKKIYPSSSQSLGGFHSPLQRGLWSTPVIWILSSITLSVTGRAYDISGTYNFYFFFLQQSRGSRLLIPFTQSPYLWWFGVFCGLCYGKRLRL